MSGQRKHKRNRIFHNDRNAQTPDQQSAKIQDGTPHQLPQPHHPPNPATPRQRAVDTTNNANRQPRFATVDFSLKGDKDPGPAGPCPHGHLDQAISLALHRHNPVRCPICRATPVFVTDAEAYPLSVLELRTPPNNTVRIHQPVAPTGSQGAPGCNYPPNVNG